MSNALASEHCRFCDPGSRSAQKMATRAALILLPARRMNYNEFRLEDRGRTLRRPKNPLTNPIAHVKQPLLRVNRGKAVVEFTPQEIAMIRVNFCASQREFAELIGISRETLRNWETGRRRPHGPARALLRAIDANPFVLARVLNWHTHPLKDEPDDWIDM